MFSADSFIARPPALIKREQRICLEAIAFAMRSAMGGYETIHRIALHLDEDQPFASEQERMALYTACWTIVDQVHIVRVLLRFLKMHTAGPVAPFYGRHESSTIIRNKMDHLHSNIPNLAKQTGRVPSVFGSLSYFRFRGERETAEGQPAIWGNSILVPFGVPTHTQHGFAVTNPAGREIRLPLDLFTFHAFGLRLEIHQLIDDLPKLAADLETIVRANVMPQAMAHSAEHGVDIAQVLAQGGEIIAMLEIEFPLDHTTTNVHQPDAGSNGQ